MSTNTQHTVLLSNIHFSIVFLFISILCTQTQKNSYSKLHANVRYNKLSNREKARRPKKVAIPVDDTDDMESMMMSRSYSDDDDHDDGNDGEDQAANSKHIRFYAKT